MLIVDMYLDKMI